MESVPTEQQVAARPAPPSPSPLDTAPLVEELEHVAFVGLVPGNLHRRDGADVQALDLGEFHQLFDELFVFRGSSKPGMPAGVEDEMTRAHCCSSVRKTHVAFLSERFEWVSSDSAAQQEFYEIHVARERGPPEQIDGQ